MEEESFDDLEVADLLNRHFVAIKADRERRPDVDHVYMIATQLVAGHGGWPMNAFLTSDRKPFFGGTYLPKAEFMRLLTRGEALWRLRRDLVLDMATRVSDAVLRATASHAEAEAVDRSLIEQAVDQMMAQHDAGAGGFGPAAGPKFPRESELLFLLDHAVRWERPAVLAAVLQALDAMARGGIHDQIGGGFHRYSVDGGWRVPHFEKLLPNQANLARIYALAYRLTGRQRYARVTRQILDYVLRDMTSAQGTFFAATDADSEGAEGVFFAWSTSELEDALGRDAQFAAELFGVTDSGNFEGRNMLHLPKSLHALAAERGESSRVVLDRVDRVRERLRQVRDRREAPFRDEKVITAWNAMMITALVRAYESLGEARYLHAAERAAETLWATGRSAEGQLWRVQLAGRSSIPALHEDHAYLLEALLGLLDATGHSRWRDRAREIADVMIAQFWDVADGGFFIRADRELGDLLSSPKQVYDGAAPSGNSVAIRSLLAAALRIDNPLYRDRAEAGIAAFANRIRDYPAGYTYLLLAAAEFIDGVVGPAQRAARGKLRAHGRSAPTGDRRWRVEVEVELDEGWHINANQPLQPELIPTTLSIELPGWSLSEVAYPQPIHATLAFSPEPLALYEGRLRLSSMLEWTGDEPPPLGAVAPLRLRVQACSDRVCLLPENVTLEVPMIP